MVMMGLRFDLRNPAFAGVSPSERLQAAIDMASWADERGCVVVSISENHGSEDGYLPAPLVFAAALAARTQNLRIGIAALLAPFYDPLRLAEDVAILDGIAGGRIDIILGAGYVPDEVTMFGLRGRDRGRLVEQAVHTLRAAWTGEPFDYQGRRVRVTPRPTQVGGPRIVLGGSSEMAARRAARIGDGFVPVDGSAWEAYRDELVARQNKPDPGPHYDNPVVVTFLAEDPEAMWPELLPYFLHETNAYGDWLDSAGLTGPYARMTGEQLRASGRYRVVTPDAFAGELAGMDHPFAFLNPMVGGVPPVLAWECLRLFDEKVRPALNA